jgi:hypothetical protein
VSLRRRHLIWSFDPPNQPPSSMDRRSSHVHRTLKDLLELISLSSLMGRCAAQQVARSIHKSGDRSAMAHCGCCTPRGSAIVAHVRSVSTVKNQRRPSKRGGSALSIGPSLHLHRPQGSPHLYQGNLHLHRLLIRCFGETGSVAFIGGSWRNCSVPSASISDRPNHLHRSSSLLSGRFPVQNEHTTVSPGRSAWRAMLADQPLQISRSSSSGYQMPLLLLSVSTSLDADSTSALVKQKALVLVFSHPFSPSGPGILLLLLCYSVSLT